MLNQIPGTEGYSDMPGQPRHSQALTCPQCETPQNDPDAPSCQRCGFEFQGSQAAILGKLDSIDHYLISIDHSLASIRGMLTALVALFIVGICLAALSALSHIRF